ncbi:hypothetical protein CTI12_AA554520 [Artemisia annua]|uniref:START domain-containing protein n=1 Tax=Artemisia annua TaxID=35608 RepID=A0A2U1KX05_ARTAN|nr:hypothetical protein CTI12_AA554520 [Artemisia annua]
MGLIGIMVNMLNEPNLVYNMLPDLLVLIAPLWIAVIFGVFVGWMWRPTWANDAISNLSIPLPAAKNNGLVDFVKNFDSLKMQLPNWGLLYGSESGKNEGVEVFDDDNSSSKLDGKVKNFVGEGDLQHISKLVEEKDGGLAWILVMDRSTSDMSYQAWKREPEVGPPQYRSRTVYENMTPEMMRDFFWDDEFRLKWDDMLLEAETIEECPNNGTMVVKWVRKDMGIPWEIAKLGVRQGMWGAVKKIDRGLRWYQKHIGSGAPLTHCARMAHVNTKVSTDRLKYLTNASNNSQEIETFEEVVSDEKPSGKNVPKLLVVGGAIALACTIDRGLLTKAVIFGVARRFAKMGRRL